MTTRTRTRTFASTNTHTKPRISTNSSTPNRVQIQPQPPSTEDDGNEVKCSGHGLKCPKLKAGPTTKNAGRAFYCCPLPRDDAKRCKFFKWHDELLPSSSGRTLGSGSGSGSGSSHSGSRAADLVARTNAVGAATAAAVAARTLGESPQARYGRPEIESVRTPTANRTARQRQPVPIPILIDDDDEGEEMADEIDWDAVDAEEMERDALNTPSSQRHSQTQAQAQSSGSFGTPSTVRGGAGLAAASGGGPTMTMTERLKEVGVDTGSKRKREARSTSSSSLEEQDQRVGGDHFHTPTRIRTPSTADPTNPFLSTTPHTPHTPHTPTTPRSPPHAFLSPTLLSLDQLSEHLHRQDRLLRAAESMKQGMRRTIKGLQDRNGELEQRVKDLEKRLGG